MHPEHLRALLPDLLSWGVPSQGLGRDVWVSVADAHGIVSFSLDLTQSCPESLGVYLLSSRAARLASALLTSCVRAGACALEQAVSNVSAVCKGKLL